MSNNVNNVTTGKPKIGGAIFYAPVGTTLPTDATMALAAAFVNCGYVSEDGVTNSFAPATDKVKAWGGDTVKVLQTDRPDDYSFTLIETLKKEVRKVVYGDNNVTEDASGNLTIKATAEPLESRSWVIDMIVEGGRADRIVIPNGTLSDLGDIVYKDDDITGYAVTLSDVPDANGVYHYEYISAEPEISG